MFSRLTEKSNWQKVRLLRSQVRCFHKLFSFPFVIRSAVLCTTLIEYTIVLQQMAYYHRIVTVYYYWALFSKAPFSLCLIPKVKLSGFPTRERKRSKLVKASPLPVLLKHIVMHHHIAKTCKSFKKSLHKACRSWCGWMYYLRKEKTGLKRWYSPHSSVHSVWVLM